MIIEGGFLYGLIIEGGFLIIEASRSINVQTQIFEHLKQRKSFLVICIIQNYWVVGQAILNSYSMLSNNVVSVQIGFVFSEIKIWYGRANGVNGER